MVELMIAIVILTLCSGMLASTLSATSVHRATNYERGLAVEAARGVVEDMHNFPYASLFSRYNNNPLDDPGGLSTASGKHFAVEGLEPAADDLDGFVGEIFIPIMGDALREDLEDAELGMPRDLNGDMVVDGLDHQFDSVVLPVLIEIKWQGRGGVRSFRMTTMLADCQKVN